MKKSILSLLLLLLPLIAFAQKPGSVSILGDSYSTYQDAVSPSWNAIWYYEPNKADMTDVDNVSQTWWSILLENTGKTLEKNNSFSGSTICSTGYRNEDYSDRAFYTRMHDLGNPETILIFGATNDSWANSPIGDWVWENQTAEQLKYFRPALAYLLAGIKSLYPGARPVFILNDGLKDEINSSIEEACARYGVETVKLEGISKNSGHPDRKGMAAIAAQVAAIL